jgi:hypothetical protein
MQLVSPLFTSMTKNCRLQEPEVDKLIEEQCTKCVESRKVQFLRYNNNMVCCLDFSMVIFIIDKRLLCYCVSGDAIKSYYKKPWWNCKDHCCHFDFLQMLIFFLFFWFRAAWSLCSFHPTDEYCLDAFCCMHWGHGYYSDPSKRECESRQLKYHGQQNWPFSPKQSHHSWLKHEKTKAQ